MPRIGQLKKYGDLNISGEIDERTPKIENGLIAHFPMDGSVQDIKCNQHFSNITTSTRDKYGSYFSTLYNYSGSVFRVTYEAKVNKKVDNLTFRAGFNYALSTGTHTWKTIRTLYMNDHVGEWKFYNDTYTIPSDYSTGLRPWFQIDMPAGTTGYEVEFRNVQYTLISNPNYTLTNCYQTENGLSVCEPIDNKQTGKSLGIYNNHKQPASITPLGRNYNGMPIYRFRFTPTTDQSLNSCHNGYANQGVTNPSYTFKANTKYCASIYWKPISHPDIKVGGTASNINGWISRGSYELTNEWKRYCVSRNGSVTEDKTDSTFFSFICPSVKLNEEVIIDFCGWQLEEGQEFANDYCSTTRGNADFKLNGVLNPNKGTVIVDFTPLEDNSRNGLHGSDQYVFGNVSNWNEANTFVFHDVKTWYFRDRDNVLHQKILSEPIEIDKRVKLAFVYDDTDGTMLAYKDGKLVTDTTKKSFTSKLSNLNKNWTHSGASGGTSYKMSQIIHNLSFYNRPLTESEIKKLCSNSISLTKTGILKNEIIEKVCNIPDDAIYFPLSGDVQDINKQYSGKLSGTPIYKEGGIYVENSKLEFNLNEQLDLDWSGNWSILYKKKPITTDNELIGYSIESIGCNSNSVGTGYNYWGKISGNNAYIHKFGDNPISNASFSADKYFQHWETIAVVKNNNQITFTVFSNDNVKRSSVATLNITKSNYYVTQHGYDLKFAGWDSTHSCPSIYRDLIVLKRAVNDIEINRYALTSMQQKNELIIGNIINEESDL